MFRIKKYIQGSACSFNLRWFEDSMGLIDENGTVSMFETVLGDEFGLRYKLDRWHNKRFRGIAVKKKELPAVAAKNLQA